MTKRSVSDYRDSIVGFVLLAFSGAYWLGANAIRVSPIEGSIGAAGLPKALAYVLAVLSIYLIVRNLATLKAVRVEEQADLHDKTSVRQHLSALFMLIFGSVYLLLLPYVGYAVAVALLMATTAYFLGMRSLPKLALFAVAGSAFFYLLFVVILKIPLPEGVLVELFRA